MSLLLDALKKAADDKQKISRGESTTAVAGVTEEQRDDASVKDEIRTFTEELHLQPAEQDETTPQARAVNDIEDLVELSLELDDNAGDTPAKTNTDMDAGDLSNSAEGLDQPERLNPDTNEKDQRNENDTANRKFAISDDALSMLVYKTNRDVKKDKFIIVISLFVASLLLILSGGIYFYIDAQAEIAEIERKHQIAIQSMRSKTSKENPSRDLEVIRNLVSDAGLDEKVKFAKQHIANKNSTSQKSQVKNNSRHIQSKEQAETNISGRGTKAATPGVSIKKSNKVDVVAEKLDTAWLAYESGNYNAAKKVYKDVLNIEDDNRDALLGLGAIAVVEKDRVAAGKIYSLMLKQDPGDPIATAALASLHSENSINEADESYLLSLLRKSPDAPHLNFSLANIYAQQNKWKSAQQYYFNAWQHDSENADYIFNLAVSMDQLSKRQQAINFYKDCLIKAENKQVAFSREAVEKRIKELSEL